jgi:hypothetical protein
MAYQSSVHCICRDKAVANRLLTTEGMRSEVEGGTRTLQTFRDDIIRVKAQLDEINVLQTIQ